MGHEVALYPLCVCDCGQCVCECCACATGMCECVCESCVSTFPWVCVNYMRWGRYCQQPEGRSPVPDVWWKLLLYNPTDKVTQNRWLLRRAMQVAVDSQYETNQGQSGSQTPTYRQWQYDPAKEVLVSIYDTLVLPNNENETLFIMWHKVTVNWITQHTKAHFNPFHLPLPHP